MSKDNIYPFPKLPPVEDDEVRAAAVRLLDDIRLAFRITAAMTSVCMFALVVVFLAALGARAEGSTLAPETSPRPQPRPVALYLQDRYGPTPATVVDGYKAVTGALWGDR